MLICTGKMKKQLYEAVETRMSDLCILSCHSALFYEKNTGMVHSRTFHNKYTRPDIHGISSLLVQGSFQISQLLVSVLAENWPTMKEYREPEIGEENCTGINTYFTYSTYWKNFTPDSMVHIKPRQCCCSGRVMPEGENSRNIKKRLEPCYMFM